MSQPRIRVLVGKPGLDGHDRGAKVIARALRDAGMEVIYSGLHQTPEQIVEAAIQEDVDVIGLSILSGAQMTIFPRIKALLKEQNSEDILLIGGGTIPDEDIEVLIQSGDAEALFTPGTPTGDIVAWIKKRLGVDLPPYEHA
ncbi:MAG: cobalamin B12-binding domain-containing protein [Desulfitobacteriaceae bacterium]|nr:cobalamin B12-binding domain-containing protein [Desulfitobacteriaceae bacterium]MDI6912831.1 cobalamin B12-binding domain-containing protein [Desulfitobacteriaceae bacterium]